MGGAGEAEARPTGHSFLCKWRRTGGVRAAGGVGRLGFPFVSFRLFCITSFRKFVFRNDSVMLYLYCLCCN